MKTLNPIIFGEVLFDCFDDGNCVLGGAPFNVAWHLQAFGRHPTMVTRIGDDAMGHRVLTAMSKWEMDTSAVQIDSGHATGEVRVSLQQGQPSFTILEDRAWDHIQADRIPPLAPSLLYHGSLGLRSRESAVAFESLQERYRAPLFLDINLRSPWWTLESVAEMVARARWLKVNDQELELLVTQGKTLEEKARRLLADKDLAMVIVTEGARGAFLLDARGDVVRTTPEKAVTVVDTVGAGDAFASVCILGILEEWPLAQLLTRAQQFAVRVVGQRGATSTDRGIYRASGVI